MPRSPNNSIDELPANNTVKLSGLLRERVLQGMRVEGFTVWAEFCRVALTEKCRGVEMALHQRDPEEFTRIYGRRTRDGHARD